MTYHKSYVAHHGDTTCSDCGYYKDTPVLTGFAKRSILAAYNRETKDASTRGPLCLKCISTWRRQPLQITELRFVPANDVAFWFYSQEIEDVHKSIYHRLFYNHHREVETKCAIPACRWLSSRVNVKSVEPLAGDELMCMNHTVQHFSKVRPVSISNLTEERCNAQAFWAHDLAVTDNRIAQHAYQ